MLDNISRYVYETYRCKSVSAAAKKLFISQPALSASIKKAEQELGTPIFNRSTLPFSLTPEGEIYIQAIESILAIEEETRGRILDIESMKSGKLAIGTATHLSYFAIPMICEKFKEKYPKIDISIVFGDTESLPGLLEKKAADLIFISTDGSEGEFVTEPLFDERCIIVIPKKHPYAQSLEPFALSYDEVINRSYPQDKEISDLSLFDGVEFVYSPPNSNLYKKRRLFFGDSGISHHVTSSSARFQLNYNLMRAGFGALFTTDSAIATTVNTDDCFYFTIKSPDATRSFSIAKRSGGSISSSKITEEFIATAKEIFDTENPLTLFLSK